MATQTEICKYAISKVGGGVMSSQLVSINDGSETANLCLDLYERVRPDVMSRAYWQEATQYADLGAEATVTEKAAWSYAFNLPADYLARPKQIWEGYHTKMGAEEIEAVPCQVMQSKLFTDLLTNDDSDSAYIVYVYNLETTGSFSTQLVEAIATKMAAELAPRLITEDKGYVRRIQLLNEFEKFLPMWIGENSMTQYIDDKGEATCLTSARWE